MSVKKTLLRIFLPMILIASVTAEHEAGRKPVTLEELNFDFQEIEAGRFIMGGEREVTITGNYAMAATETTQRQWILIMRENPSIHAKSDECGDFDTLNGFKFCPDYPVEYVSWNDVQTYIKRMNELFNPDKNCGGTPSTSDKGCFRLPTEAEWEYASGGNFLKNNIDDYGWYYGNARNRIQKVAQKLKNSNGLYDMFGNVWEWVQDWWHPGLLPEGRDPVVAKIVHYPFFFDLLNWRAESYYKVLRGGSSFNSAEFMSSTMRDSAPIEYNSYFLGFRLVRVL